MTDVLTIEEAKQAVGKGVLDSEKVELLKTFITGLTTFMEDRYGPIVYGTQTAELHDGGRTAIYLNYRPVQSVIAVVEYDNTTAATLTAETNSTKPSAGYLLNAANGKLTRRDSNTTAAYPPGTDNVYVTYVAGRYASGAVSSQFKTAASIMLKNAWSAYENSIVTQGDYDIPQSRFPTFALPKFSEAVLAKYQQSGSGGFD